MHALPGKSVLLWNESRNGWVGGTWLEAIDSFLPSCVIVRQ